jgi:hypothetical protein
MENRRTVATRTQGNPNLRLVKSEVMMNMLDFLYAGFMLGIAVMILAIMVAFFNQLSSSLFKFFILMFILTLVAGIILPTVGYFKISKKIDRLIVLSRR